MTGKPSSFFFVRYMPDGTALVSGKSRTALSLTASLDICCANWYRADAASGEVSKLATVFPSVDKIHKKKF